MLAIALPFLGGVGAPECLILIVMLFGTAIPVWFFWKIFERAGLPTGYAFLVLIPSVGFLIALAVLAFSRWPSIDAGIAQSGPPVATPPAPPAQAAAPGWLPDPTGEHELRYWNGNEWTSDVHDRG